MNHAARIARATEIAELLNAGDEMTPALMDEMLSLSLAGHEKQLGMNPDQRARLSAYNRRLVRIADAKRARERREWEEECQRFQNAQPRIVLPA